MKNLFISIGAFLLAAPSIHSARAQVENQQISTVTALPFPILTDVASPFDALRGTLVRLATTEATREALLAAISQPNSIVDEVCMGVAESDRESLVNQLAAIGEPAAMETSEKEQVTVPVIVTLRSATDYLQEQIQNLAQAARKEALEPSQFGPGLEDVALAWANDSGGLVEFLKEILNKNGIVLQFVRDIIDLIPGLKIIEVGNGGDDDDDDSDDDSDDGGDGSTTPPARVNPPVVVVAQPIDEIAAVEAVPKINPNQIAPKHPSAIKAEAQETAAVAADPKETAAEAADPKETAAVAADPNDVAVVEADIEAALTGSRRLQEMGTFIIPTEFIPQDFTNVMSLMGSRMFGVINQLSDGMMVSPAQSVLPFPSLLGGDSVVSVSSSSPSGEDVSNVKADKPLNLTNPLSLPLDLLGSPFELLGSPLDILSDLFNPDNLSIFDPSQLAGLLPLGDSMTSLDLLSAFSFENLETCFSTETLSMLPVLFDAQNDDSLLGKLSPEALTNAMEDGSPFALLLERARDELVGESGFLAPEGGNLPIVGAGDDAPIALFNLLGSDAFNDAIEQLAVETSS